MQFKHYEMIGVGIAAAICNQRPTTAGGYEAILQAHRVDRPEVTDEDVGTLRGWRKELRDVFITTPGERHLVVNRLLTDAGCAPRLAAHDGLPPHLHFAPKSSTGAARIKAMTAGGLALAIATIGGERLGRCARHGCETVFVDTTRAGRRLYCSVSCANRVRVARHRARC